MTLGRSSGVVWPVVCGEGLPDEAERSVATLGDVAVEVWPEPDAVGTLGAVASKSGVVASCVEFP